MTDKQHPEALRLAELLTADEWPGNMTLVSYARECVAELRRQHTELETLRMGYAAARLEIESLQARIKTMAEEHAEELMVAHLDGRMRAAQPAGAPQPGAAGLIGALEDAQQAINSMKVEAETAAQGDEQMMLEACETISNEGLQADMAIRAALASHGQAPAQPVVPAFTEAQIASACLSYRHDFGLLGETDRKSMMWIARQWERAFAKEREFAAPAQPAPYEIINMAREQGLPETETEGVFRVNVDDLGRIFASYRAARAPADSGAAPAGGVVAYLDIGAGGYLDLGTDLSNEALSRLPKGRNELVIAGTYGIDGYIATPTAQPAPQQEAPADELEEVLRERDDAEDFINELLDEVLGADRPEWSSAYNRYDAMNDVRERITALHKPAVDKAWGRFELAMAAPQPLPAAPVRDYPQLPDFDTVEQRIYGACRRYITQDMLEPIHSLIRDAIDADRAAQEGKSHDN